MKKFLPIIVIAVAIAAALSFKDEPEPPKETKKEDTGFDRSETENLMREIGYVQ